MIVGTALTTVSMVRIAAAGAPSSLRSLAALPARPRPPPFALTGVTAPPRPGVARRGQPQRGSLPAARPVPADRPARLRLPPVRPPAWPEPLPPPVPEPPPPEPPPPEPPPPVVCFTTRRTSSLTGATGEF